MAGPNSQGGSGRRRRCRTGWASGAAVSLSRAGSGARRRAHLTHLRPVRSVANRDRVIRSFLDIDRRGIQRDALSTAAFSRISRQALRWPARAWWLLRRLPRPGHPGGHCVVPDAPSVCTANSALIVGLAFGPQSLVLEKVLRLVIMNATWLPLHVAWLWAGATPKWPHLPPHVQRRINYAMGSALVLLSPSPSAPRL